VDFSEKATALAKKLSNQIGVEARFITSDIYKIAHVLDEEFDVVFTSGGVLTWLPDIEEWGKIVARYVKSGGFFYIREDHPIPFVFDDERDDSELKLRYPYFTTDEPLMFEGGSTYADSQAKLQTRKSYEWPHSLSSVLNSLIDAGLRIEFLHEFPFTTWKQLPFMIEREDGRWILPSNQECLPLMYSIKASKP